MLATVDTKYDSKTKLKHFQRLSKVKKKLSSKSLQNLSPLESERCRSDPFPIQVTKAKVRTGVGFIDRFLAKTGFIGNH